MVQLLRGWPAEGSMRLVMQCKHGPPASPSAAPCAPAVNGLIVRRTMPLTHMPDRPPLTSARHASMTVLHHSPHSTFT